MEWREKERVRRQGGGGGLDEARARIAEKAENGERENREGGRRIGIARRRKYWRRKKENSGGRREDRERWSG